MLPVERAVYLRDLKAVHGTNAATGEAADMTPSMVSRYLSLLNLPEDIQQRVNSGELPISRPLAALRRRERTQKTKITAIKHELRDVLDCVARNVYATQQQIANYTGNSIAATRHYLADLADTQMLDVNKEFRPYAYSLTSKGATVARVNKPKHFMSANAIHQRLLRNEIELAMRNVNPTVRFHSRVDCWNRGLFPAVGEHLASFNHHDKNSFALVIIDDYLMSPTRVLRSLSRLHDQKKTKVRGEHLLRWSDVADTVLVYVTDRRHQALHEDFVHQNIELLPASIAVRYIAPLWEFI